MCVLRANSSPPPKARELMALMVGIGRRERVVNVFLRFTRKADVLLLISSDLITVLAGEDRTLQT